MSTPTTPSLFDPFVILFIIGALAMIYGIVHVLLHPLDLESPPAEDRERDHARPDRRHTAPPSAPESPTTPRKRRRAA